jgi:hypothetical protein
MMASSSSASSISDDEVLLLALKTNGPMTAFKLSKVLCPEAERAIVNRKLYTLLNSNKVSRDSSVPPVWRASCPPTSFSGITPLLETTTLAIPLAVVDLGNVHDTLRELVPYARSGLVQIEAFADRAYNGFGVKPLLDDVPGLRVHRAQGTDRNAADIELVWFLCETLPDATIALEHSRHVVVATKDQGFQSLRDLVQRRGHRLTFVTQWSEMREFIE